MKNSLRNELIRREIRRLLERCRKYRIEPVFFGGVVTASEDDRQTPSDIDLLISRKETKTMEALLRSLGYVTDAANLHKSWEMTFVKQTPFPLEVDVHWRLTFPTHGRLDPLPKEKIETLTENFRSGAKKTIFRGQEILTPKPEDLLVYQIIHFIINHNARGLKWLYGMARDIRQTRIDWPLFLEKITSMDLKSLAYFTFRLTDDILNTKPPDKVMEALKPKHLFFPLAAKLTSAKRICAPFPVKNVPNAIVKQAGAELTLLLFLIYDKPLLWKLRFLLTPFIRPRLFLSLKSYAQALVSR